MTNISQTNRDDEVERVARDIHSELVAQSRGKFHVSDPGEKTLAPPILIDGEFSLHGIARAAIKSTNRDELFFELVKALRRLVETASHDLKNNQDGDCGGWWSTNNVSAIEQARALLSKIEPETPKVKTK